LSKAPRDPRANQKERTRAAIVEAAARLLRAGVEPTVAAAAAVAGGDTGRLWTADRR
jgi:hypothetical protein